jgi:hypothetical protein
MATKLALRAYGSIKLIEDSSYKQRAAQLASIEERGFALMLYWNQIEVALKLMRYGYSIKDGWPETLKFLGTTWKPLQKLKKINHTKYELVLGGSASSLWKTRNGIAHEGRSVSVDKYSEYLEAALWVIAELQKQIPTLEMLGAKKRRSDAQLKNLP